MELAFDGIYSQREFVQPQLRGRYFNNGADNNKVFFLLNS